MRFDDERASGLGCCRSLVSLGRLLAERLGKALNACLHLGVRGGLRLHHGGVGLRLRRSLHLCACMRLCLRLRTRELLSLSLRLHGSMRLHLLRCGDSSRGAVSLHLQREQDRGVQTVQQRNQLQQRRLR